MGAAIELEPSFRPKHAGFSNYSHPTSRPNYIHPSNLPQDPTRHKCPKCNRWHSKEGKCPPVPTNTGGNRGGNGGRSGGQWRPARVTEVETEDPTDVEEVGGVSCEDTDHNESDGDTSQYPSF